MELTRKKGLLLASLVVLFLSILTNAVFLYRIGPKLEPDSIGYIRVAKNFMAHGALLENDYERGKLIPFTERMPGYPLFLAVIYKACGDGAHTIWVIAGLHILFLTMSVFLTFLIAYYLFDIRVGIVAGLLAAFDPWSKFIAVMILPDSLFCLLLNFSLFVAVYFLKNKRNFMACRVFLFGAIVGLASMIRPILNYFWIVLLPLFLLEYKVKRGLSYLFICSVGILIFTGIWLYRNHTVAGFWGLQSAEGLSLLWSNYELTRQSTYEEQKREPQMAWLRDMIVSGKNPIKLITPLRKQFELSPYEVNDLMKKLAIENIMENPVKYFMIYIKNFMKTITTLFNTESTIGVGARFSPYVVWSEKIASFILFLLAPVSGFIVAWRSNHNRSILLFFLLTVLYLLSLTALVAGSFRYRLPLHGIIWPLVAVAFLALIDKFTVFHRGKQLILSPDK
ncbi:MAG: hypothetical protein RDU59_00985 [Thermodesulfobacteriota bacterium]|nr:hypothetical protein [Thermodesulfobacteriota bacterium]